MSSPVVWIIFPALVAGVAIFLRRWKTTVTVTLTLITLLLALSAWFLPIGKLYSIGPWSFTVVDRLVFAGRQFVLDSNDRSMLVIVYLTLAFFFAGSLFAGVSKFFVPMGLLMTAMLVASLSVQPFLYAALMIEVAVLIGVPIISPPGRRVGRGVLRYLTFFSFGFPFMLLGGGFLTSGKVDSTNLASLLPALVILGFGFAFLLAIFPINSWIPSLMERTHPYPSVFVFSLFPTIAIGLLLRFIRQYPWLLDYDIILFLGTLMVIMGGFWAAFQRDLARLLGYAVIVEIGFSLLAISQPDGLSIYAAMFLPRILALGVWGLSLSLMRDYVNDYRFRSVQGLGRHLPLVLIGVLVANFSIAGFPLLAGFPILLALWNQLAQVSSIVSVLVLLSSVGLLIGGLRSLAVFVMGPEDIPPKEYKITWISQLFLLLGIVLIVIAGLFPQWFYGFGSDIVIAM